MENGIQTFLENEKNQRSKNITRLVYFLFFAMSLSFVLDIYWGLWQNLWYWWIAVFYLSSILVVKKFFGVEYSAHWFLLGFNIVVFYFSSAVGRDSNIHFLFFVAILLIPSVLNLRYKRFVVFHTILPLLLVSVLVLVDFDIFPPLPEVDPYYAKFFGKVNMMMLFVILPVVTWVLIRSYQTIFNQLLESEKNLIQKNLQLSKTNQELDNFVYSVSHDLRAPISSVLGLIAISKLETDPKQLIYYETLKEKSLLKLDSFIKDILDYSRNSRIDIKLQKINWQEQLTELNRN